MLVDSQMISDLVFMLKNGSLNSGAFARTIIRLCVQGLDDYIFDTISKILPLALTVAGGILVVTLGWRLFRNFTRG